MLQPGRKYEATSGYRYGFNGKERSPEITSDDYDYGARIYDGRIGRWLSIDPLQAKFAGLSPYNFCYNRPTSVLDPDGKLGIEVHVKYNSETGKYTVVGIIFSDDLIGISRRQGNAAASYYWHDYIKIVSETPSGLPISETITGDLRYTTIVNAKWWAKWKVDDGVYDDYDYGGIAWWSEEGGSEETRRTHEPDSYENIDGILAMVNGGGKLATHEFKRKGLLEILEKLADFVKEVTDEKPGDDFDPNDKMHKNILKQLETLLEKYGDAPSKPNMSSENQNSSNRPKDYIIWKPTNGTPGSGLRYIPADRSHPDTQIMLYKPRRKDKPVTNKSDSTSQKKSF